jgi:hypothetical protein
MFLVIPKLSISTPATRSLNQEFKKIMHQSINQLSEDEDNIGKAGIRLNISK